MSKPDNVNLSSVALGHSIPLHNRFDMFNNTVLFPENKCTSVICDQKVVCLHSEKRDEQSNVHKKVKNINKTANNKLSVNQGQEMQETTHSRFIADKNPTDSDKGEPVSASKNTSDMFHRHRPSLPDGQMDKYDLDLRFRPRHRDKIMTAQDCVTFQNFSGTLRIQKKLVLYLWGTSCCPLLILKMSQTKRFLMYTGG